MTQRSARSRGLAALVALVVSGALATGPLAGHTCPRHGFTPAGATDSHHASGHHSTRRGAPEGTGHDAVACCCPGPCTLTAVPVPPQTGVLTNCPPTVDASWSTESPGEPSSGVRFRQPFPTGPPAPIA